MWTLESSLDSIPLSLILSSIIVLNQSASGGLARPHHVLIICSQSHVCLGRACPPTLSFVASAGVTPISAPHCSQWLTPFRLSPPLRSPHDSILPGSLGSTFVRLTHGWLHHFINHTPAIASGWRVCCLAHYVVHTLPSSPAFTVVGPQHPCSHLHVLSPAFSSPRCGAFFHF